MENEKKAPMDIMEKIRQSLKELGYEVYGFECPFNGLITIKIHEIPIGA